MNGTHIETLIQMSIKQIRELTAERERIDNKLGDIIDRQEEEIIKIINQEEIKEDWAEDFVRSLDEN